MIHLFYLTWFQCLNFFFLVIKKVHWIWKIIWWRRNIRKCELTKIELRVARRAKTFYLTFWKPWWNLMLLVLNEASVLRFPSFGLESLVCFRPTWCLTGTRKWPQWIIKAIVNDYERDRGKGNSFDVSSPEGNLVTSISLLEVNSSSLRRLSMSFPRCYRHLATNEIHRKNDSAYAHIQHFHGLTDDCSRLLCPLMVGKMYPSVGSL